MAFLAAYWQGALHTSLLIGMPRVKHTGDSTLILSGEHETWQYIIPTTTAWGDSCQSRRMRFNRRLRTRERGATGDPRASTLARNLPSVPVGCLGFPAELEVLQQYLQENLVKNLSTHQKALQACLRRTGPMYDSVDYRGLKVVTVNNHYLPLIGEIMDWVNGAKWFSKIDSYRQDPGDGTCHILGLQLRHPNFLQNKRRTHATPPPTPEGARASWKTI